MSPYYYRATEAQRRYRRLVPDTLHELEQTLLSRQAVRPAGSYSAELFADPERMQRKIMEEAFEVG